MPDLGEIAGQVAADPLRRRIGSLQGGMLRLQFHKPIEQTIVLRIVDQWPAVDVICLLIGSQQLGKPGDFLCR
jgi:hypothetical protein